MVFCCNCIGHWIWIWNYGSGIRLTTVADLFLACLVAEFPIVAWIPVVFSRSIKWAFNSPLVSLVFLAAYSEEISEKFAPPPFLHFFLCIVFVVSILKWHLAYSFLYTVTVIVVRWGHAFSFLGRHRRAEHGQPFLTVSMSRQIFSVEFDAFNLVLCRSALLQPINILLFHGKDFALV